jgi:hypothetical protein
MSEVVWDNGPSEKLIIELPEEASERLRRLAKSQGMSAETLARLYVGRGLREDMRRRFDEEVLAVATSLLAKRLKSVEEAEQVVAELRGHFA